jgi:plastocyanin
VLDCALVTRHVGRLVAALLLLGALAGCGGDEGGDGLASAEGESAGESGGGSGDGGEEGPALTVPDDLEVVEGPEADVTAIDNTFDAQGVSVAPGTTVRWTNRGRQDHDVIPAEGDEWGVDVGDFAPGDVYEHTFTEPGTYNYYCTIHGTAAAGMVGVVVVE